jgi:hypothetical protein
MSLQKADMLGISNLNMNKGKEITGNTMIDAVVKMTTLIVKEKEI